MKKKVCSCAILAVILAVVLSLPAAAADSATIQFQNGNEIVDFIFSEVLIESAPTQKDKSTYYTLAVPVGSTITEVLLHGSHGRYTITVEDSSGDTLDFYSLYAADELDAMIVAAALAGNESDYKYYTALRDNYKEGVQVNLTTQIKYTGPRDKHSGLQRRETVYRIETIGEFTLRFEPESADGTEMVIRLAVTDGTTPPVLPQLEPDIAIPEPVDAAVPTSSTVYIDGTEISFDAYNINDNNYFKLRDIAFALNDSGKRFEVTWDEAENAISLTGGAVYTAVGGEMTVKGSAEKIPEPTTARVLLDGKDLNLTAYNIDGNNYFKLRDVGQALDFNVSWDGVNNAISVNTTEGYTAD